MQKIRLAKDEVDRYLEDWATVVEFCRDGGVGYPDVRMVSGGGGLINDIPTIGARYLHVERLLDRKVPIMRKLADALYVRRIQTIEEFARQACGADREWANDLTWVALEFWRSFRSDLRKSLAIDVDWSVMDVEQSKVARAQVPATPSYGAITEHERRAIMARMGVGA